MLYKHKYLLPSKTEIPTKNKTYEDSSLLGCDAVLQIIILSSGPSISRHCYPLKCQQLLAA
jgi:hypothetical protein